MQFEVLDFVDGAVAYVAIKGMIADEDATALGLKTPADCVVRISLEGWTALAPEVRSKFTIEV